MRTPPVLGENLIGPWWEPSRALVRTQEVSDWNLQILNKEVARERDQKWTPSQMGCWVFQDLKISALICTFSQWNMTQVLIQTEHVLCFSSLERIPLNLANWTWLRRIWEHDTLMNVDCGEDQKSLRRKPAGGNTTKQNSKHLEMLPDQTPDQLIHQEPTGPLGISWSFRNHHVEISC